MVVAVVTIIRYGEEQVKLNLEHHDGHLQGGEVENQFPSMWITCTQKMEYIKSNTVKNTMVITYMQKSWIKSNTIQNKMVTTCM